MFSWFEKRKERKRKKTESELFFNSIKEIRELKEEFDQHCWYLMHHHKEHMSEQTALFMDKTEFGLTSLISCFGLAKKSMNSKLIKDKIKGIGNGSKEENTATA